MSRAQLTAVPHFRLRSSVGDPFAIVVRFLTARSNTLLGFMALPFEFLGPRGGDRKTILRSSGKNLAIQELNDNDERSTGLR